MIEPTGPLPPSVYWRRRAVAAGVCLIAVLMLMWIVGGLVGSADEQPVHGTAGSADLTGSPSSAAHSAPSSPAPSARSAAPSSAAPATSRPTLSPVTRPAGQPKPCPDKAITVAAQPGAESYRVGAHPLLRLIVVNTGEVACTREVSRSLRELVITTPNGDQRLWSSNDCYHPVEHDTRTLFPGEPLRFSLSWAGRTSARGCPAKRTTVEAGTYRLTGALGELTSAPARLRLTP